MLKILLATPDAVSLKKKKDFFFVEQSWIDLLNHLLLYLALSRAFRSQEAETKAVTRSKIEEAILSAMDPIRTPATILPPFPLRLPTP